MKKKAKIIIAIALLAFVGACVYIGQSAICAYSVGMGQKAYREGDLAKSEADFLRAIHIKPNSAFARYHYYTDFLKKQGRYEDAIPHLKVIVKVEPKYWFGYYMLGAAYHMIGQYDEALPYLEIAAEKLNGKNAADTLHRIAQIKAKQGSHAEAILILEKAMKIEPLLSRVVSFLGGQYNIVGQDDKRREIFRNYIREHIKNYEHPEYSEISIYMTYVSDYLVNDDVKPEIDELLRETEFSRVNPLLYKFNKFIKAMKDNDPNEQNILLEIQHDISSLPEESRRAYDDARVLEMLKEMQGVL